MPEADFYDLRKRVTDRVFGKWLKYRQIFFNKRLNNGGRNFKLGTAQ
jgi:hypothetical protein